MMDLESLEKIFSIIRSSFVALGIICGGVWAFYRLRILQEADKAKTELEKLKQDLMTKKGILRNINTKQVWKSENEFVLLVTVELTSLAPEPIDLILNNKCLYIFKVQDEMFTSSHDLVKSLGWVRGSVDGEYSRCAPAIKLFPETKFCMEFSCTLPSGGMHSIQFECEYPEKQIVEADSLSRSKSLSELESELEKNSNYLPGTDFVAQSIIYIEESNPNKLIQPTAEAAAD